MSDPNQEAERARQVAERESFKRRLAEEVAVRKTFTDSSVQFKATQEQVLASIGTIRFRDGIPYAVNSDKPLSEALIDYSVVNSHAIAETPVQAANAIDLIQSKADLKDAAQKSAYITQYGYDRYAALPLAPIKPFDPDTATWEEYRALPINIKAKLVDSHPNLAATLKRREQDQRQYERLVGIPTGKRRG